MLSPWIICTPFTPPLLLASLVLCNFRQYHAPNISQKNSYTYCKNLEVNKKTKYYAHAPRLSFSTLI